MEAIPGALRSHHFPGPWFIWASSGVVCFDVGGAVTIETELDPLAQRCGFVGHGRTVDGTAGTRGAVLEGLSEWMQRILPRLEDRSNSETFKTWQVGFSVVVQ